MNETEMEHRLTEVESRSKSNTHRIDKLERVTEEIHTMSTTMIQLVEEVKHTNETVSSLNQKVEKNGIAVWMIWSVPREKNGATQKEHYLILQ